MYRLILSLTFFVLILCGHGDAQTVSIDDLLHRPDARHGTFGPTGKRLFTERLEGGLGFHGQFCYIHHADIRDPIRIELHKPGGPTSMRADRVDWYPSHLMVRSELGLLTVTERKFITDDDTLVDLIELRNSAAVAEEYYVVVTSGFATASGDHHTLMGSGEFFGVKASGVVVASGFLASKPEPVLSRHIRIAPGESLTLVATMAMHENPATAEQTARAWLKHPEALKQHRQTYQAWFDRNCPQFECDDALITKLYWYRWFVARHCLSRAATGNLPEPYFFEGTHQSHFPRLIAFSSPHIISEVRWLRDPVYAFGQVRNHCLNPDPEHKFFISARINQAKGEYNNWIVKSAWEAFWIHPDEQWLRSVVDALADSVTGCLARFDEDHDYLPAPRNHWTTGMEFQPAFFYFNDYDDTKPEAKLERGDFVAYAYGNARAVANAYRHLDRQERAKQFDRLADEIQEACLSKMWDDQDGFCYAIREEDDAVARCREIVGFYPFFSRLFPDQSRYTDTLAYLVDPTEFWTPFPPATVTRKCPAFTYHIATWPAAGGKTHGCMWNGPTWPHACSVVIDIAAAAIQDYRQLHLTPEHFRNLFERFTRLQYENGDWKRPMVTEYYDGQTGAPDPTGCPDYFHSTYCDLVIKYLVGLQPANTNRLVLKPIPGLAGHFSLRGVRYRGHDIDIVYNAADATGKVISGLSVWIDGRHAGRRPDLGTLSIELP